MRVELRDEARNDLTDAAHFYDRQSSGLGDHFIDCLERDLWSLTSTHGIHETAFGFHRKLATNFPFSIYYLVRDHVVDVVAILDCREDPRKTEARLGRTTT